MATEVISQRQTPVGALGGRIDGRAWAVFAISFALLLSDYMSRQVLSAVFPLLKAQWALSDARLGALGGVVALMVGVLTAPLSLTSDSKPRSGSRSARPYPPPRPLRASAISIDQPEPAASRPHRGEL